MVAGYPALLGHLGTGDTVTAERGESSQALYSTAVGVGDGKKQSAVPDPQGGNENDKMRALIAE